MKKIEGQEIKVRIRTGHISDVVFVVHEGTNLLYRELNHGAWSLLGSTTRQSKVTTATMALGQKESMSIQVLEAALCNPR
jgi:hypothetical protein